MLSRVQGFLRQSLLARSMSLSVYHSELQHVVLPKVTGNPMKIPKFQIKISERSVPSQLTPFPYVLFPREASP